MPNPFRAIRDWSRSRQAAAQLYDALKKARPGGIDIPKNDPEMAAALMKLQADPRFGSRVTVVKNKHNLTLAFREDVDATLTSALGSLVKDVTARPGEDLVDG